VNEQEQAALETIQRFITLYRHLRHYSHKMHKHGGIRGRDLAVLRYLLEHEKLKIGQIQKYLFISYSSTSDLISRLEDAGYVSRTRCKKDNRVVFVVLTDAGRELAENTPLGGIPLLREKIKSLPPERLAVLDEAFVELLNLMEIDNE
jgi:DNA-binding MarR family transcriptional regulator